MARRATLDPNASTPIDYLEKIFQVAYEVPPMRGHVDDLIDHLMPLRPGPHPSSTTSDPPTPDTPKRDTTPSLTRDADDAAATVDSPGTHQETDGPPRGERIREPATRPLNEDDQPSNDRPSSLIETSLIEQRTLEYSPREIAAVRAASTLVDTPRTLKRLINVYRVLRATADPAAQLRVETDCAYIILLLAIANGRPIAAPNLFALINHATPRTTQLPKLLKHHLHNTTPDNTPDQPDDALPPPPPAHLAELYQETLDLLDTMGPDAPTNLATYQYWLPIAARYSFRHHRLTSTPPPSTSQAPTNGAPRGS